MNNYWKDIPSAEEQLLEFMPKTKKNQKRDKGQANELKAAEEKAEALSKKSGDKTVYMYSKDGAWIVTTTDPKITGSIKPKRFKGGSQIMEGKKGGIIESAYDSDYLQNALDSLIDDFKSGPAEEKKIVPMLKHVLSRINQSYPDGDVSDSDVADLLREPSSRKVLKKAGMSSSEAVSMIMDF